VLSDTPRHRADIARTATPSRAPVSLSGQSNPNASLASHIASIKAVASLAPAKRANAKKGLSAFGATFAAFDGVAAATLPASIITSSAAPNATLPSSYNDDNSVSANRSTKRKWNKDDPIDPSLPLMGTTSSTPSSITIAAGTRVTAAVVSPRSSPGTIGTRVTGSRVTATISSSPSLRASPSIGGGARSGSIVLGSPTPSSSTTTTRSPSITLSSTVSTSLRGVAAGVATSRDQHSNALAKQRALDLVRAKTGSSTIAAPNPNAISTSRDQHASMELAAKREADAAARLQHEIEQANLIKQKLARVEAEKLALERQLAATAATSSSSITKPMVANGVAAAKVAVNGNNGGKPSVIAKSNNGNDAKTPTPTPTLPKPTPVNSATSRAVAVNNNNNNKRIRVTDAAADAAQAEKEKRRAIARASRDDDDDSNSSTSDSDSDGANDDDEGEELLVNMISKRRRSGGALKKPASTATSVNGLSSTPDLELTSDGDVRLKSNSIANELQAGNCILTTLLIILCTQYCDVATNR
jgi:hypothetical protein